RIADEGDDLIDIGNRNGEADQDMSALAGLVKLEDRPAGDDLFAELDEGGDDLLEIHQLRPAAIEGQRIDAEAGLQWREAEELVEHHFSHGIALQLDDDADTFTVGFIAKIGDALNDLLAHDFRHALDHAGFVHLIGNLGDDDGFAVLADFLHMGTAAHDDGAAAGMERIANAAAAEDQATGREVRAGDDLHQLINRDAWIVHIGAAGIDHF